LEIVLTTADPNLRAVGLSFICPALPQPVLPKLAAYISTQLADNQITLPTAAAVWPYLTDDLKAQLHTKVIQYANDLQSFDRLAPVLLWMNQLFLIDRSFVNSAVSCLRSLPIGPERLFLAANLYRFLPDAEQQSIVNDALSQDFADEHLQLLALLAFYSSPMTRQPLLDRFVAVSLDAEPDAVIIALSIVINYLSPQQIDSLFPVIDRASDEQLRVHVLTTLVSRATPSMVDRIATSASQIRDPASRARIVIALRSLQNQSGLATNYETLNEVLRMIANLPRPLALNAAFLSCISCRLTSLHTDAASTIRHVVDKVSHWWP
jgi:hypothetical protein